jgi:hypothetical protein
MTAPSTSYVGGPWGGTVRLGRLRPELPPDSMGGSPDDPGPDALRLDAHGGSYVRISADGVAQDVYEWRGDNERLGAA